MDDDGKEKDSIRMAKHEQEGHIKWGPSCPDCQAADGPVQKNVRIPHEDKGINGSAYSTVQKSSKMLSQTGHDRGMNKPSATRCALGASISSATTSLKHWAQEAEAKKPIGAAQWRGYTASECIVSAGMVGCAMYFRHFRPTRRA